MVAATGPCVETVLVYRNERWLHNMQCFLGNSKYTFTYFKLETVLAKLYKLCLNPHIFLDTTKSLSNELVSQKLFIKVHVCYDFLV
jgi:hypothetical protein